MLERSKMNQIEKAAKWVLEHSDWLVRKILAKQNFTIAKKNYDADCEDCIIEILQEQEEVKNVLGTDEGIKVYL